MKARVAKDLTDQQGVQQKLRANLGLTPTLSWILKILPKPKTPRQIVEQMRCRTAHLFFSSTSFLVSESELGVGHWPPTPRGWHPGTPARRAPGAVLPRPIPWGCAKHAFHKSNRFYECEIGVYCSRTVRREKEAISEGGGRVAHTNLRKRLARRPQRLPKPVERLGESP